MLQAPRLVSLDDVLDSDVSQQRKNGRWLPARPLFPFIALAARTRLAWGVFTGRYDALDWEER